MTEKQAYSYTVLRYIHDVVSGEVLNVGVVMHAPAVGFLKVRTRKTVDRLKQAFPDLDDAAFIDAMLAVDRGFATVMKQVGTARLFDAGTDARALALNVLPEDDSALQWSPAATGLTANPDRTLERLYERYITRYDAGVTVDTEGNQTQASEPRISTGWQALTPVRRLEPDITTEELKRVRRKGGPGPAAPNVDWRMPREARGEGEDMSGGTAPDAA